MKLHHSTYYETKAACPGLVSDLLIQARVKATEALKSAFTWKQKHEASYSKKVAKALKQGRPAPVFKPVRCPQSLFCPVRYNEKTYTLNWQTQTIRVSTTQGKVSLSFTVSPLSARYAGYKVATADLLLRKGTWWLHVVVDVPEPIVDKHTEVIGIDLGLTHPAVTSHHQFLGSPHWKEVDRRTFRLRRKLQSNGSKSAKRHLKKMSKKQQRFHRDCDHVLSKRIVQQAPLGATIVLENLTNIRDTSKIGRGKQSKNVENKRKLHGWTFAQFYSFISYKGQERGIEVVRIDPAIPRKPARAVAIKPVTIAVLNPFSFAENAATAFMPITMLRKTSETSILLLLPVSVYPWLVGRPVKRPLVTTLRSELQASAFYAGVT